MHYDALPLLDVEDSQYGIEDYSYPFEFADDDPSHTHGFDIDVPPLATDFDDLLPLEESIEAPRLVAKAGAGDDSGAGTRVAVVERVVAPVERVAAPPHRDPEKARRFSSHIPLRPSLLR